MVRRISQAKNKTSGLPRRLRLLAMTGGAGVCGAALRIPHSAFAHSRRNFQRPSQQRETRALAGCRPLHAAASVARAGQEFPSPRHCEEAQPTRQSSSIL